MKRFAAAAAAFVAFAGTLHPGSVWNFTAGTGSGMALDRARSAPLESVTAAGKPAVSPRPAAGAPAEVVLRLDGAPATGTAALLLEYYDVSSPDGMQAGGDTIEVSFPAEKVRTTRLFLACREKANEPYRQARWRRHFALLPGFKGADGASLTVRFSGTAILRAAEILPLDGRRLDELARFDTEIADAFLRQARLAADRARVEEAARQCLRAALYAGEAAARFTARIDGLRERRAAVLSLFRDAETLADRRHYEGRLAVVEGRPEDAARIARECAAGLDAAGRALDGLRKESAALLADINGLRRRIDPSFRPEARIRPPTHPWAGTIPRYFRERIRFFVFANSPWTGTARRWFEFLPNYGIEAVFYICGYEADRDPDSPGGDPWAATTAWNGRTFGDWRTNGLAVMPATLHLHHLYILGGLPGWFRTKYRGEEYLDRSYDGERNTTGQNSGTVNIFHPGVRAYAAAYAAAAGRHAAADPSILGMSTFNEHRSSIRYGVSAGYTDLAARAFRRRLAARYGDIAALNRRWKTSYAGFDDIRPPLPVEKEPWQLTPLFHEWTVFMRESMEEYCRMVVSAFKTTCPDKPVWLEGEMSHLGDIGHSHVRPIPDVNLSNYNIRRIHRKAIVDAETAGAYPEGEKENPAEVGRAALERNLFDALLWGQRGFDFWLRYFTANANGYYAAFHDNPSGALVLAARDYSAVAAIRGKADRFSDLLADTEVLGTGVGIVKAGVAMAAAPLPAGGFRAIAGTLYTRGWPPFAVSADDIADGREDLRKFGALIVLASPVVREGLNAAMLSWVRDGGLMIAEGPWGLMTPDGGADGALVREAFGEMEIAFPPDEARKKAIADGRMQRKVPPAYREICPWERIGEWHIPVRPRKPKPGVVVLMADTEGNPLLVEAPLGKGKVVMSSVPIYGLGDFIRREIGKRMTPPAVSEKEGALYTIMREDVRGARYLGLVNPSTTDPVETAVLLSGRYRSIADLGVGDGFPVPATVSGDRTRIPVRLDPGEGTILRLGRPL